ISARNTTFSVYSQGLIQFMSSFTRGGDDWTDLVAGTLGVTSSEAREIKHHYDASQSDAKTQKLRNLFLDEANRFTDEIQRTRDFYLNREDHPADFEKIILVGGAAQLPSLAEFISQKISLPVEIGRPAQILDPAS